MTKESFFLQWRKFIEKHNLFDKDDHILLAVSGGIDSMVLAHLFKCAEFQYSIAHVNHKMREGDSDADEQFVRDYANRFGVPFFSLHLDPKNFNVPGVNFQEYTRQKRYHWFNKLVAEYNYQWIATAHHRSDAIETSLMNFARGTGLKGMAGIPLKNNKIIRPLLFTHRKEIEEFARIENIPFREDSSNTETKYRRNFMRHEIISKLSSVYPEFESTAFRTIENFIDTNHLLEYLVSEISDNWLKKSAGRTIIALDQIKQIPGHKSLVHYLLLPFGFESNQLSQILEDHDTGALFYSSTHQLLINRGELFIEKRSETKIEIEIKIFEPGDYQIPGIGILSVEAVDEFEKNTAANTEIIALDNIELPISLRKWRDGDLFKPIGMKSQTKKVQDLLTDLKVDLLSKRDTLILEDQHHILWVIPYRLDERIKIKDSTKSMWKISFRPKKGR